MYSDPAALKIYGDFSGMPETVVRRVRELMPKDSLATDSLVGIDQIMAEAVQNKFLAAPLTKDADRRSGAGLRAEIAPLRA